MGTTFLRLLGAVFAVALLASACGNEATTTSAAAEAVEEQVAAPEVDDAEAMEDDAAEGEAMDDEAMEAMEQDASHDDASHSDDADGHSHGDLLEVGLEAGADVAIPAVEISLTESDEPGIFDLDVTLTNFTITPENVDGDPIDNEGHMHLYLDGQRVERFYDLDHQIAIPEGEHLVEVELSSNNHAAWAVDGVAIRGAATVTVEGAPAAPAADLTIGAVFAAGAVTLDGDERIEASVGDVVTLTVDSDVAEEIHLHGYDIFADVAPGETTMMTFTADTPGRFEIEFEASHAFIAELVVS